uniref:Uncharacterized protein n=1 Tax=Oryza meridionalis TaxID=40149 RepID=A0A0E0EA46_9ORYZ
MADKVTAAMEDKAATKTAKATCARCACGGSGRGMGTAGPPYALQRHVANLLSDSNSAPDLLSLTIAAASRSPLPLSLLRRAAMGGPDLGGGETTGGWRRRFIHCSPSFFGRNPRLRSYSGEGDEIGGVELYPLSTAIGVDPVSSLFSSSVVCPQQGRQGQGGCWR